MIVAILSALPYVLKIIAWFIQQAHDRGLIKEGQMMAIADEQKKLNTTIALATGAAQVAAAKHAKDKTDAAFDDEFERKD